MFLRFLTRKSTLRKAGDESPRLLDNFFYQSWGKFGGAHLDIHIAVRVERRIDHVNSMYRYVYVRYRVQKVNNERLFHLHFDDFSRFSLLKSLSLSNPRRKCEGGRRLNTFLVVGKTFSTLMGTFARLSRPQLLSTSFRRASLVDLCRTLRL